MTPFIFAGVDTAHLIPPGQLGGIFTEAEDITHDLSVAVTLRTRLVWLHDGLTFEAPPKALRPKIDILSLECYLTQGETFQQSQDRWFQTATDAATSWSGQLGITGLGYTQFLWTEQQVLDCQPVYNRLMNLDPRFMLLSSFAWGRGNAIPQLPEVLRRQVASSPGVGALWPMPHGGGAAARFLMGAK